MRSGRHRDADPRRNGEGYLDLTAYKAIQSAEEEERFHKLLHTIFYLCELAGFQIEGRLVLRDKRSGRVWK